MTNDFSFKWFAQQPFYRTVNSAFLELVEVVPGQHILELACGTGAVTKLILERVRGAKQGLVIGLDASASAIKEAMDHLGTVRDGAAQFVQSQIEHLSEVIKERVDTVIFCNGIHYISDKDQLLEDISGTLHNGGVFAFNTSFFRGAHLPETEQFYRRWMFKAIRLLRSQRGLMPKADRVQARQQLSPEEYFELVQQHGFSVVRHTVQTTQVPLEGWLGISRFEDFVRGALPGVPLKEASETLQEAVKLTFQEMALTFVPRNWLSVVALKEGKA